MFGIISAALGVLGSILTIIIWLGSYKRRREARRREILKEIQKLEIQLGTALQNNDTVGASTISARLRNLREEYSFLNRQG